MYLTTKDMNLYIVYAVNPRCYIYILLIILIQRQKGKYDI